MTTDRDIEDLVRRGEIDQAAALAQRRGNWKRAAELHSFVGRTEQAVVCALRGHEWRLAMEVALTGGDERVLAALARQLGEHPGRAAMAAAQAQLARREDVAAMALERTAPAEAAQHWYNRGDHARAAACFERAGDLARAMRAYEQHLAQSPDDAPCALRLADLRAAQGDDAGAVRALQAAARVVAEPEVMAKLACGLARLGYEQGALDWVLRLRGRDPTRPLEVSAYAGALPRSEGVEKRYAGRYRVVREAGSGAAGRVLEAVDELTGDTVALKVLTVSDDKSAAFGRFMREAELGRSLDDPTLVRLRAVDPEGPTIVYDWMPGGTLAERVGKMGVREVRAVALRLLGALEVLHRNGVVHRDLKPSNVLFDPAGQARLGDLGAAHLGDLGATVTGGLVGSLPYMAPEQVTGAPVSAATDFYALGCVVFQMLTGSVPFPGPDFVAQHLGSPPPRVSSLRPALGTAFDDAVARLLAKDPLDRPQDAPAARALLLALPWNDVPDDGGPLPRPISSIPTAVRDEGGRLAPSLAQGRWTDARLQRDIERLLVPREALDAVARWAAVESSDLQTVYDVVDEGDEVAVWLQPAGAPDARVGTLPEPARGRVSVALERAGVAPSVVPTVGVVSLPGGYVVVPLEEGLGLERVLD